MGIGSDALRQQRRRRLRRGCSAAVIALGFLVTTACASDPDDGTTAESPAQSGDDVSAPVDRQSSDGAVSSPAEPADVAAGLSRFQAPGKASGLPPADPAHCPGAVPGHLLSVFPEATEHQAASAVPEPPDAAEDELFTQCRMSYEVDLLDDECTVMEVRDVAFNPAVEDTIDSHDGALTAMSTVTYFIGVAQKPGIVLDYKLSAACETTSDLSDLEDEFRSIWLQHRDQFLEAPPYEHP